MRALYSRGLARPPAAGPAARVVVPSSRRPPGRPLPSRTEVPMPSHDIALIGLGVMGQNLVLNIDRHGFAVAVYNRTRRVTEQFVAGRAQGTAVKACYSMQELIAALKTPAPVLLLVKAGSPVDAVIQEVRPHLQAGDILIDGGNSHFADTGRRAPDTQAP